MRSLSSLFRTFVRLGLAAIFLASGVGKLVSPGALASILVRFVQLSHAQSLIVSIAVSVLEIGIGVLLLIGISTHVVGFCVLAVTGLFTVGQVWILQNANDVDCGCFGSLLSEDIGWLTVTRNLALMFAA